MTTPGQFVLNDDTLMDTTKKINTNFYRTIIYLNQFAKTPLNGGYIKIPYFMPSGEIKANLTMITPDFTTTYKAKELFIFKATHNIQMEKTFDAELVIKLQPTTGNSGFLWACFLLKNVRYQNTEATSIDKLIAQSMNPPPQYTSTNIEFQPFIDSVQKKIVYPSGIDTVVIFTSPISISEVDFTNYQTIPVDLFAPFPVESNRYSIVSTETVESFRGRTFRGKSDKIMTCSPIDINDSNKTTGKQTATYLMDNQTAKMASNLGVAYAMMISFVMCLSAYFGSPSIYKYGFSEFISEGDDLILGSLILLLLIVLLGFSLLLNGIKYDKSQSMVGMMFLLFTLFSVLSIANARALDTNLKTPMDMDRFKFFDTTERISSGVWELIKNNSRPLSIGNLGIWGYWLFLFVILIIPVGVIAAKKDDRANQKERSNPGYRKNLIGLILGFGLTYGLVAIIYGYFIKSKS
jgi:hypothetical protein